MAKKQGKDVSGALPAIRTIPVTKYINTEEWNGRITDRENNRRLPITDDGFRAMCNYFIPELSNTIESYCVEV